MAQGPRKRAQAVELARLADAEARRALARSVAVLPVGSTEQHGAHLPVSTDTDIAAEVSRRLADRLGLVLLPPVPVGSSFEHAPLLNLSVSGASLRRLVADIGASLADAGAAGLAVINGHHGNQRHLQRIPARIGGASSARAITCAVFSYWHFMERDFDHAGHVETSIMLALGRADMSRARRGYVEPDGLAASERRRRARLASRSFTSVARGGVWGDPTTATAAQGRAILGEVTAGLAAECARRFASLRRRRL